MLITDTLWFEIALVSFITAVGNIVMGHFEEGKPKWRRVMKFLLMITLVATISATLGRPWALGFLVLMMLAVFYVHMIWLPSKGINGWTAEPREKYYVLRGWKMPGNEMKSS